MNLASGDSISKLMAMKFALFHLIHMEMTKNKVEKKMGKKSEDLPG